MGAKGRVLLINPWIYDFAAHNLWIEPLGLLMIGAVLRQNDYGVSVIDCLAPHAGAPQPRPDGSGKLSKVLVDKPEPVANIPRHYGCYGWTVDQFNAALAAVPPPDLVLVASGMTYWYPGVVEVIRRVRSLLGSVPVALGGVYATLCSRHARERSGADEVLVGPGVVPSLRLADEITGHDSYPEGYVDSRTWPSPAHEMVERPYAGIATSWGCPYRCTYCASSHLQPVFVQRDPSAVVEEISACAHRGITDYAFYDDALLLHSERHIMPILEGVLARGLQIRFHTPNGLHAGQITADLADLMRRAGFAQVRLSLETVDEARQSATGGKVTTDTFEQAIAHLRSAGYQAPDIAAYILVGLPDQPLAEVEATIGLVHRLGALAKLALFSPIPGTPEGDRALARDADPLWHNNTVYPYMLGEEYVAGLQRLKSLAKGY